MDKRALDKEEMDFLRKNLFQDAEIHAVYQQGSLCVKTKGGPANLFVLCCEIIRNLAVRDPSGDARHYADVVAETVKAELEEGGV